MKKLLIFSLSVFMLLSLSSTALAEGPAVAEVGGKTYDNLPAAIAAAASGQTVVLLENVAVADQEMTVPVNTQIILDLNGKTITGSESATGNFNLFHVKQGGSLTVRSSAAGGVITLTAANNRGWNAMSNVIENRGGTVNIESGTLQHLGGTDMAYVVNVNANSYGDATLNVYGGMLHSTYTAVRLFMDKSGTAFLNIYDGTVGGDTSAVWAQAPSSEPNQKAEIKISGGTVNTINTARNPASVVDTVISGGTINGAIKAEAGEIHISGGNINASISIFDETNAPATDKFITGGTFVTDVSQYMEANHRLEANWDGSYTIVAPRPGFVSDAYPLWALQPTFAPETFEENGPEGIEEIVDESTAEEDPVEVEPAEEALEEEPVVVTGDASVSAVIALTASVIVSVAALAVVIKKAR